MQRKRFAIVSRGLALALSLMFVLCVQMAFADRPLKLLAIGNSFSEDAIEQNLFELAAATGHQMVIGNMYIGGCSLERHWGNAQSNKPDYDYRKIDIDGKMTRTANYTLDKALRDEQWDYVSLQQVSQLSGMYNSFQPHLDSLIAYVRARVPATTKLIWHVTWAYTQNSTHGGFANYDRNQDKMYRAIVEGAQRLKKENAQFSLFVPVGTAIQNARTSFVGDHLNRDGFHLDLVLGRYTAACTWFECLFGTKVVGNRYAPKGLNKAQKAVAQWAAHLAVELPFECSPVDIVNTATKVSAGGLVEKK
ncbi:DUF4886 domain-containing protein [Hoylesella shahii]|uniref:DUF4886 domain-containing protein n=1 Tax=Hoylesella shahii TaxID=228603 RepID=UPI0028F0EE6B|nr:DUF4886 domain-containing protein [Hoylesella shahii]